MRKESFETLIVIDWGHDHFIAVFGKTFRNQMELKKLLAAKIMLFNYKTKKTQSNLKLPPFNKILKICIK
jgi:hypothetical protein